MGHDRQLQLLGRLPGQIERGHAGAAAGDPAGPDLDAHHQIQMLARRPDGLGRIAQAQIAAFADHDILAEAEDAGEGDVEIGQDAGAGALDDMPAKAQEVAGPGAASVDEGGGAAPGRQAIGIDAQRGAAPIDMAVQVDQAGRDHAIGGVDQLAGIVARQAGSQLRHLAVGEGDIGRSIDALAGIKHPAAMNHQIVHRGPALF